MSHSEQQLRQNIAKNIAFYRKQNKDTQADLADRLNYSDKSVSKWERAEGTPDIVVLSRISTLYGITVDDLLREEPVAPKTRRRLSHLLIVLMSLALVALVATAAFFCLDIVGVEPSWICFLYALPVCGIVLTVFSVLWFRRLVQCIGVSLIVWGLAVAGQVSVQVFASVQVTYLYIVAAAFQVLAILWFFYLKNKARAKKPEVQPDAQKGSSL